MSSLKIEEIDVVILCGGLGTRLGSEAGNRPKSMVDINGKPFLDILIRYVASFGFVRFILCVGYKNQFIVNHYANKRITPHCLISEEKTPLGTGGAIKHAEHLIESSSFIVLNGDSFCPASLKEFHAFHEKKQSQLSLVLSRVQETEDFGSVLLNQTSEILGFNEKDATCKSGLVNSGIYFFEKKLLSKIPLGQKVSLEYDFFPTFVGRSMFGYVTDAELFDIGTPERLAIARKKIN